jgi:hypothetical protein
MGRARSAAYHGLDPGMPDEMVRDLAALAGER